MARSAKLNMGLVGLIIVLLVFAEIAAIVWVASEIGWWTVLILATSTVLGVVLLFREWKKAWAGLAEALRTGEMRTGRLTDATLVLVGGMLLVLPGLLTDILGLLLLLPFTRPFVRSAITWWASRTLNKQQGSPSVIKGDVVQSDTLVPEIEQNDDRPVEGRIIDDRDQ